MRDRGEGITERHQVSSDSELRASGRFSVRTAIGPTSSRSRMSGVPAAATVAGCGFIGLVRDAVLCGRRAFIVSDPPCRRSGQAGKSTLNKDMAAPALTVKELERFLAAEFPQVFQCRERPVDRGGLARRLPRAAGLPGDLDPPGRHHFRPDHDGAGRFRHVCRACWLRSARCRSRSPSISTSISCASPRTRDLTGRGAAAQARQAARGRRGDDPLRRGGGARSRTSPRPIRSRQASDSCTVT